MEPDAEGKAVAEGDAPPLRLTPQVRNTVPDALGDGVPEGEAASVLE
jgi:hypothetical protein